MILNNLLSNAHDFSGQHGKVALSVGKDAQGWWLSVVDNGPGINRDELNQIFKPFTKAAPDDKVHSKAAAWGLRLLRPATNCYQAK